MSTAKHSPLPWRYKAPAPRTLQKAKVLGRPHPVDGGDYAPIAECDPEDAALIVKSVNLHDELVAALTEVAFDAQYPDRKIGAETLRRVKELLARARQ